MARYDGQYWSSLGQPLNRDVAQPVPQPTALNSPQVGIDLSGEGLLAWQEPDDSFRQPHLRAAHLRDGARQHPAGQPRHLRRTPAQRTPPTSSRSTSLALVEGAVAWRQEPPPGSGFTHASVFLASSPPRSTRRERRFGPAQARRGSASGEGPSEALGPLSMAVDTEGAFDVGYGAGDESFDTSGAEASVGTPVRLDQGSEVPGDPVLTRAANGALAAAWKVQVHGAGGVAVLERRADGTPNRSIVAAPHGGAVHQLAVGGSHRGDAIFGFLQGDGANAQIAAVVVRAPPGEFVTDVPHSWVKAARIPLQWEVPLAGAGKITYSILVDDRKSPKASPAMNTRWIRAQVGEGVHTLQVEATDSLGQVVDSVARHDQGRPHPTARARQRARRQCHGARQRRAQGRSLGGRARLGQSALRRRAFGARAQDARAHLYARGSYTIVVTRVG